MTSLGKALRNASEARKASMDGFRRRFHPSEGGFDGGPCSGRSRLRFCLTQGRHYAKIGPFKYSVWTSDLMMGALLHLFLLLIVILGSVLCVFGPVTVLGVMFWKWHKELAGSLRLQQARSTQVR